MSDSFCVYEHVFPNGKRYIGISSNAEKRWRNGKGYETQPKVARAIKKYGWDNIEHNIIVDNVTKGQAETLERYLIAELHTIDNGYNVAIGGENINGYYLDEYILSMIRYAENRLSITIYPVTSTGGEEISIVDIVSEGKTEKGRAEWANEASRAVTLKHRKYSPTKEDDVLCFWFHMREYYLLSMMVETGQDVTDWKEAICPFERYTASQLAVGYL